MSEQDNQLPSSFLLPATERLSQVQRAFGHIAQAVELELAGVALNPSELTEEDAVRYQQISEGLLSLSGLSRALLKDIESTTGIQASETESPTEPATIQPIVRRTPTGEQLPRPRATRPAGVSPRRPRAGSEPGAGDDDGRISPGEQRQEEKPEATGLYAKILDTTEFPEMATRPESAVVEVSIVGNNRVKIGDIELTFQGHDLFILNALLKLRDKPRAAGDIRDLGFYPGATNGTGQAAFSSSMKNVKLLLNKAAGVELVKQVGKSRSTRYCVNPNLVLVDNRDPNEPQQQAEPADVKKNYL